MSTSHIAKAIVLGLVLAFSAASQQLNQNCVVAVLNRTVQVNADGSWILPNVPANFGLVRARATCVENGLTTFGQSDLFLLPKNGTVNLPHIPLGNVSPVPTSIAVTAPSTSLTTVGGTTQLTASATYSDRSTKNITAARSSTSPVSPTPPLGCAPRHTATPLRSGAGYYAQWRRARSIAVPVERSCRCVLTARDGDLGGHTR